MFFLLPLLRLRVKRGGDDFLRLALLAKKISSISSDGIFGERRRFF
jgi:hypothetical protein